MKMNSRRTTRELPIYTETYRSEEITVASHSAQTPESSDISKGFNFENFTEGCSNNMNEEDFSQRNSRQYQTADSQTFLDRNVEYDKNAIPNDAWPVSHSPNRDKDKNIMNKEQVCNSSSSSNSDNNNQESNKPRTEEKLNYSLRHTKLQSLNYKLSENMTVAVGISLIVIILILHGLFIWLMCTVFSYDSQTFGWKIALDIFFMSIQTSSSNCTLHTKKVKFSSPAQCIREEGFMHCPYTVQISGTLSVFIFVLGISIFTVLAALLFLTSRIVREYCGFAGQYFIRSLTLLCCWIGLWFSVPIIVNFYFCFLKLKDAMNETINTMNPPDFVSQWWDQTQTHSQCCGISDYLDWEAPNKTYPMSCCNFKNNECKTLPTEKEVWVYGCYDEEHTRLQFFGGLFVAFWMLKLIGEIVLYIILSHVFANYSTPLEKKLRSSIRVHGYKIKLHGHMDINSVPNRSKVVVELPNDVTIAEDCKFTTKATGKSLLVMLTDNQRGSLIGYAQITAAKCTNTNVKNVMVGEGSQHNCFNLILS